MEKLFYMHIKMANGAEFEYKQDTHYPLIGTIREKNHEKCREALLDSIDKISSYLVKENES